MPISLTGSTEFSTWVTFSSSKHLTTWTIASTSRMCERNLLPSPSPLLAPFTSPAMSTNSIVAGVTFLLLYSAASLSSRSSGTATTPTFGSIVQNGKFAACAPACVIALKSVDLPTFGNPTTPSFISSTSSDCNFDNFSIKRKFIQCFCCGISKFMIKFNIYRSYIPSVFDGVADG